MTRHTSQVGVIVALLLAHVLLSQTADSCRGARGALNRVKEEITPELGKDPNDSFARERLKTMFSTVETASRVCPDVPELFYYRAIIAERLGDKREAAYAQRKQREANYQASYNPFTVSPAQLEETTGPPGPVAKKWALVVGVNNFQDKAVPTLRFAAKDSQDFAHYLTDPKGGRFDPSRVKNLVDSDATTTGFWEAFGWLRANVKPEDLVVIYLSSHGSPREDDPNGVSFIVMNDTNVTDHNKTYATSVEMIDLVEKLNREIKARRVVLFLDTCYSGDASAAGQQDAGGSRGIRPVWKESPADSNAGAAFSGSLQKLKQASGRAVITASRANELSWEGKSFQNGYFTHFLITELRQSNDGTGIADVFPKIRNEVTASVKSDYGQMQTPSAEFNGQAETIVINVPEKAD